MKGQKIERFDLVPVGPLRQLAAHYGKGADKYTRYGECDCRLAATTPFITPSEIVAPVTSEDYESATRSSQNDSVRTGVDGESDSLKGLQPKSRAGAIEGDRTDSARNKPALSWGDPATFAVPLATGASTTTTTPELSEGACVTDAISDSDITKSGSQNTANEHSPTCASRQVVQSGDRNWERGVAWSLNYAAAMRHLTAWWGGEDNDPETGSPHLAAVAWHMFALLEYSVTHPDKDDRPSRTTS